MTQTTSKPGSAIVPAQQYAIVAQASGLADLLRENVGQGGLSPFDLDRVKIPPAGMTTWEIPTIEGPQDSKELIGIIVAWADKRSYWAKSMDESGGGSPPDCNSEDGVIGVGSPTGHPDMTNDNVEVRFTPDGKEVRSGRFECARCPLAQFGSGKNNAQACKSMKFAFLISPERMLPMLLAVPPSSLKPWKQYMLSLASNSVKYNHVVTRFSLEKTNNAGGVVYSRLVLAKAGNVEPDCIPYVEEYTAGIKPLVNRVGTQRMDFEN